MGFFSRFSQRSKQSDDATTATKSSAMEDNNNNNSGVGGPVFTVTYVSDQPKKKIFVTGKQGMSAARNVFFSFWAGHFLSKCIVSPSVPAE